MVPDLADEEIRISLIAGTPWPPATLYAVVAIVFSAQQIR
jgi:hypothetical protein